MATKKNEKIPDYQTIIQLIENVLIPKGETLKKKKPSTLDEEEKLISDWQGQFEAKIQGSNTNMELNRFYELTNVSDLCKTSSDTIDLPWGIKRQKTRVRVKKFQEAIDDGIKLLKEMSREFSCHLPNSSSIAKTNQERIQGNKVFIVHGHDDEMRDQVRDFLKKELHLEPIVLKDRPNNRRVILGKFEEEASGVCYAVVLLSPDDVGYCKGHEGDENKKESRARQNVVFEMGYFFAKLNNNVAIINREGVNLHSDVEGLVYIPFSGNWKDDLRRELEHVGIIKNKM